MQTRTHSPAYSHISKPLPLHTTTRTPTSFYKIRIFIASFGKMNFWSTAAKFKRTHTFLEVCQCWCDTHTWTHWELFYEAATSSSSLLTRIPNSERWKSQGKKLVRRKDLRSVGEWCCKEHQWWKWTTKEMIGEEKNRDTNKV